MKKETEKAIYIGALQKKNLSAVEPPNNGHIGDKHFVHCSVVVPSSEVEICALYRQGASSVYIVGRLSTLCGVHYQRFYCISFPSNSLVIQSGPGVKDIACGGMAQQVREAFAGVMHAVVELASKQPSKCINTIAMLCVVPYTRSAGEYVILRGREKNCKGGWIVRRYSEGIETKVHPLTRQTKTRRPSKHSGLREGAYNVVHDIGTH